MIATIHQPEHLPWLGFFGKASQADVLILLDTVQYRTNYFQNRNRILTGSGARWLTVPVLSKHHTTKTLADMEIDSRQPWRSKHWRTIEQSYRRHEHWSAYVADLQRIYEASWVRLVELNRALIDFFFGVLMLPAKIRVASDLRREGARSELLLSLVSAVGADAYLAGPSAKEYLDEDIFKRAGIDVRYHEFSHPTYPQRRRSGSFVPYLSTLDLIMNCGRGSAEIIRSGSSISAIAS